VEGTRPWLKAAVALVDEHAKQCRGIFHGPQLRAALSTHNQQHPSQKPLTQETFIEGLKGAGALRVVKIAPVTKPKTGVAYKTFVRYVRGDVSAFDMAVSLRPGSYLSHATAARLHGILDTASDDVFVNKEQSVKQPPNSELTQDAIDNAFSGHPRESNLIYKFQGQRIFFLNGKNTRNYDVVEKVDKDGSPIPCTGLERTLVDMTVRPVYSGGAAEVLKAFHAARERVSIERLIAVLAALGHKYPYHQAVGFYLERAGFSSTQLAPLKALGLNFNFYLTHGPTVTIDQSWRLHLPSNIRSLA